MSLGLPEIAILAVIALLLFGAGRIPKAMGDLAGGIKAFKRGMNEQMADAKADAPKPDSAPKA